MISPFAGASEEVKAECCAALVRVKKELGATKAGQDGGYLNLKARHVLNLITRPKKKYEEDLEDQNQVYWMLQRLYDPETPVASLELQVSRGA